MSKKRRIKMELIRDVLQILWAQGNLNKTELVYAANLNYDRASCILDWVMEHELVTVESGRYMLTEKGKDFTLIC